MTVLYVPWFNETDKTFGTLWEILPNWIEKLSLPWHPWENFEILFSLTSTREVIEKLLWERQDINWIITTSLSAWPVIQVLEKTQSSVWRLLLLNPAFDPFQAVVRMYNANPLIQKKSIGLKEPEDFLWDDKLIFNDFLWGWRIQGDGEIFQADLRRFSDMGFATEHQFFDELNKLTEKGIENKILYNTKDAIIFPPDSTQRFRNSRSCQRDDTLQWRNAKNPQQADYSSHIPVFTDANKAVISKFFQ